MRTMKVAAAAAVIAALSIITACGGSGPSQAACKSAMQADYAHALAYPGAPAATEPAACKGLPQSVITKLAGEVMAGQ
jgi:hypothetical protein